MKSPEDQVIRRYPDVPKTTEIELILIASLLGGQPDPDTFWETPVIQRVENSRGKAWYIKETVVRRLKPEELNSIRERVIANLCVGYARTNPIALEHAKDIIAYSPVKLGRIR